MVGRIDQMDHPLEAKRVLPPPPRAKTRAELLEMLQQLPEQSFGHGRVTFAIGVREVVAAGRGGPPDRRLEAGVQVQGDTDIVESHTMGQLGEEQRDDVTPGQVGPRLLINAGLAGQLGHQMIRNEIAELAEDGEGRPRWLLASGCFSYTRAVWHGARRKPTSFRPHLFTLWDGCDAHAIVTYRRCSATPQAHDSEGLVILQYGTCRAGEPHESRRGTGSQQQGCARA